MEKLNTMEQQMATNNVATTDRRTFLSRAGLVAGAWLAGTCPSCVKMLGRDSVGRRPNIIFLLTDDQRWDTLGCGGNSIIHTPNMDNLAHNGVRFERAFVSTPICAASRASILTGLYERKHDYTFTKPPLAGAYVETSYPRLLRRAGYRTGFVGKFGVSVEKGETEEMFDFFKPSSLPYFKQIDGQKRHLTDINGDRAIEFLRSCDPGKPFCLSLSFWAPHADDGNPKQYFWPETCDNLYRDVKIPIPQTADPAFFEGLPDFLKKTLNRTRWYWRFDTPEKYQEMVKGYYRMISGVDMVIGRLMQELKNLKLDQDTIIILMGDNGYFLGERGYAGKWTMHDVSIRVPLIVYDPRKKSPGQGMVLKQMVMNVDIAPTILEMAQVNVPEIMQGQSFVPLLNGKKIDWRDEVFCEHLWDNPDIPQTEGIRTDRWKYIRYPKHPDFEELYDLANDPMETINLADRQEYRQQLLELRRHCDQRIEAISPN